MTRIPLALCVALLAAPAQAMAIPDRLVLESHFGATTPESLVRAEQSGTRLRPTEDVVVDEGGGASGVDVIGFLVGLFIGLGLGHFIVGEVNDGLVFLVVELVLLAIGGGVIIWLGPAAIIVGAAPLLLLIVRIWEIVDLAGETFGAGGDVSARAPPERAFAPSAPLAEFRF